MFKSRYSTTLKYIRINDIALQNGTRILPSVWSMLHSNGNYILKSYLPKSIRIFL